MEHGKMGWTAFDSRPASGQGVGLNALRADSTDLVLRQPTIRADRLETPEDVAQGHKWGRGIASLHP